MVQQIIRPTGLVDPRSVTKPVAGQVDDLMEEIRQRVAMGERVLVTTLTKRMAEDLTDFLKEAGIKVRYLHSDIDTLERMAIIRDLRQGVFDVLVGINLLREGLDLPEVSLVAILDADKEGFLRSDRALIQTMGWAARNVNGRVVMYADQVTDSMQRAVEVTCSVAGCNWSIMKSMVSFPRPSKRESAIIEATRAAEEGAKIPLTARASAGMKRLALSGAWRRKCKRLPRP